MNYLIIKPIPLWEETAEIYRTFVFTHLSDCR